MTGYVLLTHMMDTVTIDYKLKGVDPTCTVRDPDVQNSCGMHIHVGFSCESDLAVGIHYWDQGTAEAKNPDPWVNGPSYYQYDATMMMAKGEVSIKYGYGVDASKSHAFVIHDRKGTRISCGVLPATTDKVTLGQFAPYPMYEGPLKGVQGCVNMDFRGVSVAIGYDLAGVDPLCTTPNADIPNSCGLHIHTGMTCTNASEIEGHYFDVGQHYFPSTPMPASGDPWSAASVMYNANTMRATGSLQVDYGFGFDTSRGRAVVLHDYNGTRIACALLPMYVDRVSAPLPALAPYPGYMGPPITGSVKLDFRGNAVKILYNLQGTESTCASGVPGDAPNSCGIHIHSGFTCAEAGMHYFNSSLLMMDPWEVATYKSQASESSLIVGYGYSLEQTKGRTVVVHSYNGTRVACANIPATSSFAATVTNFMPLFGAAPIAVASTVLFDFRPTSVRMNYNLAGVDAACVAHGDATNSCGLHIHTGFNCSAPGEHFYATEADPWTSDYYVATSDGRAMGYIDVEYGYGFNESRGRAVVVHNYAGTPVACSTLPMASDLTDHAGISAMVPLPGANTTVPTAGTVLLAVSGLGVRMDYALTAVEPMCSSVGPAPLSCGIHIHKGFSCDEPMTHYYNNVTYPADPWMYSAYTSLDTMAYGSVIVSYGESWAATEGRVVVVHNYAGEKVSCAVIPQTTDQVTATGFTYLANATANPGSVLLDFRATSVLMTYNLMNVDAGCNEPAPGVMNSCGLHIHSGMSCASIDTVGPHYYDNNTFSMDPWASVVFKSDASGHAMGMVNVEYGFGYEMTRGRVVVIHDKMGTKVYCAPIPMQKSDNEEMSVSVTNIAKYPEYNGPYSVGITALSLGFKGVGTKITYELSGVPCECSQMGTKPNSCGLHIHVGMTCMDATQIGGHWYNSTMIANDPWASTTYTSSNCAGNCLNSNVGTTASGAITIDYGYGPSQTLDKVLVVHDYLGNRIACSPISDSSHHLLRDLDMTGVLSVAAFPPIPVSASSNSIYGNNVTGNVQLHFVGPEVSISYRVHNVDPRCTEGARQLNVANSCGMHIHAGFSCATLAEIGEHYFPANMTRDPWQDSYYAADPDGSATGTMSLVFGYTVDESKGRTFVFHDFDGQKMTCSVLGSTTDRVTLGTIMPIMGYSGPAKATAGCIGLEFRGTSVQINANLTKVDPRCSQGPSGAENSCGIHIHVGTSCDNATAIGLHFYDPSIYASDVEPWKYVSYTADDAGNVMLMKNVEYGYGFDMSQGHAFVLHDHDGAKATCNLIPVSPDRDVTPLPALQPYPGYSGPLNIQGSVKLDFRGKGVKISYNLNGTEPTCTTPGPAPNSCGIHIHVGFTCDNAGAHYFNSSLYPVDPWSAATYMVSPMPGSLIVSHGFDYEHSKGRTVVVHDYSGARVACAVIPATTDRATATNFVKLSNAPLVQGNATLDFRTDSVHISYNFTQVDQRCSQPEPGVKNSCGLHIHQGMSCDNSGEHYYNAAIYTMDPWANITYKASDSNANGFVDVEFGYGFLQSRGHTLVLHDADGNKMACAVISTGDALRDTVGVVSFTNLEPTALQGKVLVDFQGMGVKLSYDLMGVETNCSTVGSAKLSCGIHIHQGFDCSAPMEHYYNVNSYPADPWMYASYTALGNAARGSLVVSFGEDYAHSMGRSLVLHNYAGQKIACQTIPQITDNVMVTNFKPLPDTPHNETTVMGTVGLAFRADSVQMNLTLRGVDPRCVQKSDKALSCGVHIHQGSCPDPKTHYFDPVMFPMDPWMNVSYVSNAQGEATGLLNVEFGYGYASSKGRSVVIHDQDGLKMSCGDIGVTPLVYTVNNPAPMRKYPQYEGIYSPVLTAHMKYTNEAVTISYNLTGVPCECSQIGTAANSCGLHIHEGTSCSSNGLVGGHWYNNHTSDPWAYTPYIARKCSEVCTEDNFGTTASGSLTVNYGYDYATTISRVLVVHDYYGVRIGCAPLAAVPQINPTRSTFPTLPVVLGGAGLILLLGLVFLYCRRRKTQRGRVGTLNEKLAPAAPLPAGQVRNATNPTRRTLSVNHM